MQLDDLIAQVHGDEPLDRLSSAMGVKADLDELSDSLIGHFVDQARRAGCSWSEIGSAMGVTKQAAQQRHTSERPRRDRGERPWRFGTRFTGRAKAVVREASSLADELGHDHLGTEHLLLGILAVPRSLAGEALAEVGFTADKVHAALAGTGERRARRRMRDVPFTPRAKQVMEGALGNALRLGHNYVGTEHILLTLFDVPDGIAAKVLTEAGVTKDAMEAFVVERLSRAS